MSRHKNVRKLNYDDYYDDDNYYDDEYYEDEPQQQCNGANEWDEDAYYEDQPVAQTKDIVNKNAHAKNRASLNTSANPPPGLSGSNDIQKLDQFVGELMEILESGAYFDEPVHLDIDVLKRIVFQANYNVDQAMDLIFQHMEQKKSSKDNSSQKAESGSKSGCTGPSKAAEILSSPEFQSHGKANFSVEQITFSMKDLHIHDAKESVPAFDFSKPSPDDEVRQKKTKGAIKAQHASKVTELTSDKTVPSAKAKPSIVKSSKAPANPKLSKDRSSESAGSVHEEKYAQHTQVDTVKISQKDLTKLAKLKVESVKREKEKRANDGAKRLINLVVVGHVDAGKSTLMGHLLYLKGLVDQKTMHKFEKESKEIGKGSFKFAWVLDSHDSERARGVTVDVAIRYFETNSKLVALLDAPGHRDFVPNMISGASQADFAILVVDSTPDGFEAGFQENGQTKEHAILLKSLGVNQIILAINKLDNVNWDKSRFDEVVSKLAEFLRTVGFKDKNITAVPVSGLKGENILEAKELELVRWYKGPSLVDVIDKFAPPTRSLDSPFRFSVSDVFKSATPGVEISAGGKIESGALIPGEPVRIMPHNFCAIVKSISRQGDSVKVGLAGDNVELNLVSLGENINSVSVGQIICDRDQSIKVTREFTARLLVLNIDVPILNGTQVIIHANSIDAPGTIEQLVSVIDKKDGSIKKKKPRVLTSGMAAEVRIKILGDQQICLEPFTQSKTFGRIMLRRDGRTIAVGVVISI